MPNDETKPPKKKINIMWPPLVFLAVGAGLGKVFDPAGGDSAIAIGAGIGLVLGLLWSSTRR